MRRLLLFNIFQPIGFPVVNLNRVNRNDSAIFRGLGFLDSGRSSMSVSSNSPFKLRISAGV